MTMYVKKPIPVRAWQIDTLELVNQGAYPYWVEEARKSGSIKLDHKGTSLIIDTLEGSMSANDGDYLIKGPKGEYWFNKKAIFEEMYEEFEESPQNTTIEVEDVVDLPDGSAIITFSMDEKTMRFFAQEGVKRVLTEVANKVIEENGS